MASFVSFAILVINFIENIKRFFDKNVEVGTVMKITMLKFPFLIDQIFPFLIFLATILTFVKLTKNNEILVSRAAGISPWQIITAPIVSSFLIGLLSILILNPIVAASLTKYERMLNEFINRSDRSILSVSQSGLWLKEEKKDDVPARIFRASHITTEKMLLHNVIIWTFTEGHNFADRIDARSAILQNEEDGVFWLLKNVILNSPNSSEVVHKSLKLKTNIALQGLQDSFSKPEMLPFWEVPGFIKTLKKAGFSALKHKLFFGRLLLKPLYLCSMALIALVFALRMPRFGKNSLVIFIGVSFGFVLYFISDIIFALGVSGNVPVYLAMCSSLLINLVIGTLLLLHYEDG